MYTCTGPCSIIMIKLKSHTVIESILMILWVPLNRDTRARILRGSKTTTALVTIGSPGNNFIRCWVRMTLSAVQFAFGRERISFEVRAKPAIRVNASSIDDENYYVVDLNGSLSADER